MSDYIPIYDPDVDMRRVARKAPLQFKQFYQMVQFSCANDLVLNKVDRTIIQGIKDLIDMLFVEVGFFEDIETEGTEFTVQALVDFDVVDHDRITAGLQMPSIDVEPIFGSSIQPPHRRVAGSVLYELVLDAQGRIIDITLLHVYTVLGN